MRRWLIAFLIYWVVCGPFFAVLPVRASLPPMTNFAFAVLSQGYNSSATSIVASTGSGAKFPSSFPYPIVWWNCTDYGAPHLDPSVEIVSVTNRTSDTFTITRGQEGTSPVNHNTAGKQYCIAGTLTQAMWDAIQESIDNAGGAINDVVDVAAYDGGSPGSATLNTAVNDLCGSSALKTLRVSDTRTVTANLTVCPNVSIWIIGSGLISINNTVVLTIRAPLIAPVRKVFDGLGTVAGLTYSRGEWFNCQRDGSADDTACLQKAADSIASNGGQLMLGVGTYRITSSLSIGSYVAIEGFGPAATFIKAALTTSVVKSPNLANTYSLWHFKNFTIDNTAKTNAGGICLNLTNIDDFIIENVYVQNCETGVLVDASGGGSSDSGTFRNVDVLTTTNGFNIKGAENLALYSVKANNCTNCIDINFSTAVYLYTPRVEAFTNGFRIGNSGSANRIAIYGWSARNTPTVGTTFTIGSNATGTSIFPGSSGGHSTLINNSGIGTVFYDGAYLQGIRAMSETITAYIDDLSGACTFAASTTCSVSITNFSNANYRIQLACNANKTFWWSSKTASGFTINASSSSSDTCDWWISAQ